MQPVPNLVVDGRFRRVVLCVADNLIQEQDQTKMHGRNLGGNRFSLIRVNNRLADP
jgi:hypothetical protein